MLDSHGILPAFAPHKEDMQIFLHPCHHIFQSIIRLELGGTYPTCGRSTSSFNFTPHSPLYTVQCRYCVKTLSICRILWIVVSNQIYFKLLGSQSKLFGDFCLVILPPPLGIYEIDHSGHQIVAYHLKRHIITQEAMSWLSTLGGGFSCLGDQFEDAVSHVCVYSPIFSQNIFSSGFFVVPYKG